MLEKGDCGLTLEQQPPNIRAVMPTGARGIIVGVEKTIVI